MPVALLLAALSACISVGTLSPANGGVVVRTVTPPAAVLVTVTVAPTLAATATATPVSQPAIAAGPTQIIVSAPTRPATDPPSATQAAVIQTTPDVPTSSPPIAIISPPSDIAGAEQTAIDINNQYRAQAGLSPMIRDETIMNIARTRVADMIARGYSGHYDPITSVHLGREMIAAAGYSTGSENWYASGQADLASFPAIAMNWFINDPPHAAGILSTYYTQIGVGIGWNGQMWIVVQNFAVP